MNMKKMLNSLTELEGKESKEIIAESADSVIKSKNHSLTEMMRLAGVKDITEAELEVDDEGVEEYANAPDEQVKGVEEVTASGDDMHRSKRAYAKAEDGDNPMAAFEARMDELKQELLKGDN